MPECEVEQRTRVCRIAREYVGTPYHDLGEVKGRRGGVDCATLLKLVYVEAGLIPRIDLGQYSPQFYLHRAAELYMGRVLEFAHEIPETQAKAGDVVLWKVGRCFGHGAIIVDPGWPHIIHAHSASRMVVPALGTDGIISKAHDGGPRAAKFFSLW